MCDEHLKCGKDEAAAAETSKKMGWKKMELSGHSHQSDKRVCRCLSLYHDTCIYVLMALYILSWPNLLSLAVRKLSAKCITQRL